MRWRRRRGSRARKANRREIARDVRLLTACAAGAPDRRHHNGVPGCPRWGRRPRTWPRTTSCPTCGGSGSPGTGSRSRTRWERRPSDEACRGGRARRGEDAAHRPVVSCWWGAPVARTGRAMADPGSVGILLRSTSPTLGSASYSGRWQHSQHAPGDDLASHGRVHGEAPIDGVGPRHESDSDPTPSSTGPSSTAHLSAIGCTALRCSGGG